MVLEYSSPNQISGSNQLTIYAVRLMEYESLDCSSNEIEKDRIRKEIIAKEVARRRMLELEVRRELMMEREIAISCGGDRFAEPMLFKEKMGMGVSAVSRHDKDMISEVPFRYRVVAPNISTLDQSPKVEILQLQPSGVNENLLVKPGTIFFGAKRKAITLTEAVADKPPLSSAPVKNVTQWSCALCHVCTTNQDGLNVHLQGKKHKRKEVAFREQKDDKNCSIGLSPKKPKFIQLMEHDLISGNQFEEGSSGINDNGPPSLLIDDSTNDMRKNTTHEKQNNGEFKFWCETCKIGTFSEKVMETHKLGKKHIRHLQQLMETQKDKQCQD
ncbi:hypothetical protein KY290_006579 [Solanum tuberosum]|uniref:U1-type domain-containing protein n=1 Tax=Solanum tuberosum TaxID=4113 RepID=A0ABQ7WJR6_SOLTU|nr:hypothetical protein KY289_005647 [Solanum tuberosum]KAH0780152.1 hypothetical protein KY290_006579 [Solanum tuberosum]